MSKKYYKIKGIKVQVEEGPNILEELSNAAGDIINCMLEPLFEEDPFMHQETSEEWVARIERERLERLKRKECGANLTTDTISLPGKAYNTYCNKRGRDVLGIGLFKKACSI